MAYHQQDPQKHMEHIFRITDIEVANSHMDDKIVGVFRFESASTKRRAPILVVIAEVYSTGYVYDQLIDVINGEAERSRHLTIGVDTDPVSRFEKIVQNVNNAIGEFVQNEPTPINWTRVNIFLLELSEGHICLAGVGQLMNMFLQKQEEGTYKTYDLFGSLEQSVDLNPQKLFSSIICGDMKAGDLLIAGSRNLERLRNELRLKERLTTLPPVTAGLEIRQDLERQAIPDDFVGTIIACMAADAPKPAPPTPLPLYGKSTASVEQLRNTEERTARELAPTITPRATDVTTGEPVAPIVGGPRGVIAWIRQLINRDRVRDIADMTSWRGMNAGFGTLLTKRRKSLLMGSAAFVIAILIIGSLIKHARTVSAERTAWTSSYNTAKSLVERGQGEAVYSEDRARSSLLEAEQILERLENRTKDQKTQTEALRNEMRDLKEKLRKLVIVSQPTQLFALPASIADGALIGPVLFKGFLVAADRSSNSLVIINVSTRDTKRVALSASTTSPIRALAPGQEHVVVAFEDGNVAAINPAASSIVTLSLASVKAQSMTDMMTYASRLYRLDAASGQIWRYRNSGGNFGGEQAYLQAASTSLNDAVSLAIDSNVYVLKSNGQVVRFYAGGQDGFSLATIDPELKHGTSIWTIGDGTYIAIADKEDKRVVLFSKEGRLISQITSPVFKGPVDIALDEAQKKLYVTDANTLYEIALP
jgi:hypothetical protein